MMTHRRTARDLSLGEGPLAVLVSNTPLERLEVEHEKNLAGLSRVSGRFRARHANGPARSPGHCIVGVRAWPAELIT